MSRDRTGESFRRPTDKLFYRVFGRFVPAPPSDQVVFSYGNLREHVRVRHCLIVLPVVTVVYGVFWWVSSQWKFLFQGPALLFFSSLVWAYHQGWLWLVGAIAFYAAVSEVGGRLIRAREPDDIWGPRNSMGKTPGFLGAAAVFEEQWFREGSESWTTSERLRANLVFGLVHLPTLIYPFIWVAVIPFGGMALTWAYMKRFEKTGNRREAVQEAVVYHWVFNMTSLGFLAVILAFSLLKKLVGVI